MLTPATAYAVRALARIAAESGRPARVSDLAKATRIPAPYLAKILHRLGRKGIVHSRRGIGGGAILSRPADAICLYDVAEALDDPILHPKCMLGLPRCSEDNPCAAHRFWSDHQNAELEFYRRTTIAGIANSGKPRQFARPRVRTGKRS